MKEEQGGGTRAYRKRTKR